ncbi:MAG: multidrug transporter MatE [Proteobacteria bacterium]|nr:MAG: multidrug transporter MatE [Pseudomonadota bacterium]
MSRSFISDLQRAGRSRFLIIGCGLASASVTARYLGPAGSGAMAALLVFPSLFMSLGSMGVRQSAGYLLGQGAADENSLRSAILAVWLFTSAFGASISYLAIRYLSSFHDTMLSAIAVSAVPFTLYPSYLSGIYLGKNKLNEVNRVDWVPPAVTFLLNLLLVVGLGMELAGALIAYAAGPMAVFAAVVWLNPLPIRSKPSLAVVMSLLRLGLLYALSLFIINLNYRIDLVLLDRLTSATELGLYAKGASVTQYLWQIPMLLSLIVFARGTGASDPREYSKKVARLLRVSLVLVGLASIGLCLLAKPIVLLLYGPLFERSADVIRVLLGGVVVLTVFKVMNMDLASKGRPWVAVWAMLPSLVVNVGLNLLLIPRMGAMGAAVASTVSYCVAGVLFSFFYARSVRIRLREIFGYRRDDLDYLLSKLRRK